MTVDELLELLRSALQLQAAGNAAEMQAKETCKVVKAEQQIAAGDVAVAKAEIVALASPAYKDALRTMFGTVETAENARAEAEYLKARFDAWRTKMATQRERMKQG